MAPARQWLGSGLNGQLGRSKKRGVEEGRGGRMTDRLFMSCACLHSASDFFLHFFLNIFILFLICQIFILKNEDVDSEEVGDKSNLRFHRPIIICILNSFKGRIMILRS